MIRTTPPHLLMKQCFFPDRILNLGATFLTKINEDPVNAFSVLSIVLAKCKLIFETFQNHTNK